MDPQGFIEEGDLDASLKKALKLGMPPDLAYQMVTLNVAEHFRLDHLLGSLSPDSKHRTLFLAVIIGEQGKPAKSPA